MEAIAGVTIVVWLLGSASGERAEELHAGRLRMLCEKLVDTHVRGLVYEGAGSLPDEVLAGGAEIVRRAAATWSIPVEVFGRPGSCGLDRGRGGGRGASAGMTGERATAAGSGPGALTVTAGHECRLDGRVIGADSR